MSWLKKIRSSLKKTSHSIGNLFKKGKLLDEEALEEIETLLLQSDVSAGIVMNIIDDIASKKFNSSMQEVQQSIANQLAKIMSKYQADISLEPLQNETKVLLFCGINGGGKTTSIGKLAAKIQQQGHSVVLAACDTFRAAATEQLEAWGERLNIPVITGEHKQDPASIAHLAYRQAQQQRADFLLIDTSGRMHNNVNLMSELSKFDRVLKKLNANAPHETILVLDGTSGQNAVIQAENFTKTVPISGLIVTKLDSSAKGGFLVNAVQQFKIPIYAIGVGEKITDLGPFCAQEFAEGLLGIESD